MEEPIKPIVFEQWDNTKNQFQEIPGISIEFYEKGDKLYFNHQTLEEPCVSWSSSVAEILVQSRSIIWWTDSFESPLYFRGTFDSEEEMSEFFKKFKELSVSLSLANETSDENLMLPRNTPFTCPQPILNHLQETDDLINFDEECVDSAPYLTSVRISDDCKRSDHKDSHKDVTCGFPCLTKQTVDDWKEGIEDNYFQDECVGNYFSKSCAIGLNQNVSDDCQKETGEKTFHVEYVDNHIVRSPLVSVTQRPTDSCQEGGGDKPFHDECVDNYFSSPLPSSRRNESGDCHETDDCQVVIVDSHEGNENPFNEECVHFHIARNPLPCFTQSVNDDYQETDNYQILNDDYQEGAGNNRIHEECAYFSFPSSFPRLTQSAFQDCLKLDDDCQEGVEDNTTLHKEYVLSCFSKRSFPRLAKNALNDYQDSDDCQGVTVESQDEAGNKSFYEDCRDDAEWLTERNVSEDHGAAEESLFHEDYLENVTKLTQRIWDKDHIKERHHEKKGKSIFTMAPQLSFAKSYKIYQKKNKRILNLPLGLQKSAVTRFKSRAIVAALKSAIKSLVLKNKLDISVLPKSSKPFRIKVVSKNLSLRNKLIQERAELETMPKKSDINQKNPEDESSDDNLYSDDFAETLFPELRNSFTKWNFLAIMVYITLYLGFWRFLFCIFEWILLSN